MRISDWSSDVCSSDLILLPDVEQRRKDAAPAFPALVAGLPLGGKARPRYRALLHPPVPPAIRRSFAVPPSRASLPAPRSEEHTSELQSLMRISYAVFCLKKKPPQLINNIK